MGRGDADMGGIQEILRSEPRTAVREIQTPIRGQYLLCSSRPLGRDEQSEAQIEGFSPRSVRLGSPPNVRIAAAHKLYISQAAWFRGSK